MHLMIAPGIYAVGGRHLSGSEDGLTLLVLLNETPILIGCGSGKGIELLLRNIIELGVDPRSIDYILAPLPHPSIVNGCRALSQIIKPRHIVAPPEIARTLYQGIGVEPCPVSLVSNTVSIDSGSVSVMCIHEKVSLIKVVQRDRILCILLTDSTAIRSFKDIESIKDLLASSQCALSRLCLYDECMCRTLQVRTP